MKKKGKDANKSASKAVRKKKGKHDFALWSLVVVADLIAIFILVKSIIG